MSLRNTSDLLDNAYYNCCATKKGDSYSVVQVPNGTRRQFTPEKLCQHLQGRHCYCPEEPCPPEPPCPPHPCDCCFTTTYVSSKNPTNVITVPSPLTDLNSVLRATAVPLIAGTNCTTLTNWTSIIVDADASFNLVSGVYTTPSSGDYQVELVLNYTTSDRINVSPDLSDVPTVEFYDVVTGNRILGSTFPVIDFCIPFPDSSSCMYEVANILSRGQIYINAQVPLLAGQTVAVKVCLNGLTSPPAGSPNVPEAPNPTISFPNGTSTADAGFDTTLTIFKVRDPVLL